MFSKKQIRVRSMVLQDRKWSTNSYNEFASLGDAEAKYRQLVNQWRTQIDGGTFLVELTDFSDHSHDKSVGI